MNRGKYIVIEGPEGVGKTTQLQELARRLQTAGLPVRTLREPDSQSDLTARAIRQLTQDPRYPMNTRTEVLLYNAARAQSLTVIKQSVEHGVICLVDRNYLTTLAIQYYGRGDVPDYETINSIITFAVAGIEPDLCIVLDAPVQMLRARLKDRYNGERFDNLDDAFLERVRAGYLWEAKQRNLPVIFASQEPAAVAENIWKLVADSLAIREPSQAAAVAPPASVKEIIEQKKLPELPTSPPPIAEALPELPSLPPLDYEEVAPSDAADSGDAADIVQIVLEEASYLMAPTLKSIQRGATITQHTPATDSSLLNSTTKSLYYTPDYFNDEVQQQYRQAMDSIFTSYVALFKRLTAYIHASTEPTSAKQRDLAEQAAAKAQAIDSLRAMLPLATVSSFSLSTPKQGMDELITDLLSQQLPEAQRIGQNLQQQGHQGTPLMLENGRVLDGNEAVSAYRNQTRQQLLKIAQEHLPDNHATTNQAVSLSDFWPRNELLLLPDMLYRHSNQSLEQLQNAVSGWSYAKKTEAFKAYIGKRQSPRQLPGAAFEKAHYSWDIVSDYGSFLDIQQQVASEDLCWQQPTPRYGYDIPQIIEAAGLSEEFEACFDTSLKLHSLLQQAGYPLEAQYAVLLGHKLRWKATYNAHQTFLLLETSYEQPATTALIAQMQEKLSEVHPLTSEATSFATGAQQL